MVKDLLIKYPNLPEEVKTRLDDLFQKEERYEVIFNKTLEGILVAEIKSRKFYYANPAICKMLGYTREELLQMRVFDIHPEEELDHVIQEFKAQARNQKVLAANIPCLRKDGTVFYCDIKTASAKIQGITYNIGLFIDITHHKLAEASLRESEERFRIIFEHAAVGVAVIDTATGNFIDVNQRYCDITKLTPDADYRIEWWHLDAGSWQNETIRKTNRSGRLSMPGVPGGTKRGWAFRILYI